MPLALFSFEVDLAPFLEGGRNFDVDALGSVGSIQYSIDFPTNEVVFRLNPASTGNAAHANFTDAFVVELRLDDEVLAKAYGRRTDASSQGTCRMPWSDFQGAVARGATSIRFATAPVVLVGEYIHKQLQNAAA